MNVDERFTHTHTHTHTHIKARRGRPEELSNSREVIPALLCSIPWTKQGSSGDSLCFYRNSFLDFIRFNRQALSSAFDNYSLTWLKSNFTKSNLFTNSEGRTRFYWLWNFTLQNQGAIKGSREEGGQGVQSSNQYLVRTTDWSKLLKSSDALQFTR